MLKLREGIISCYNVDQPNSPHTLMMFNPREQEQEQEQEQEKEKEKKQTEHQRKKQKK
jgi:hypothetical protein